MPECACETNEKNEKEYLNEFVILNTFMCTRLQQLQFIYFAFAMYFCCPLAFHLTTSAFLYLDLFSSLLSLSYLQVTLNAEAEIISN